MKLNPNLFCFLPIKAPIIDDLFEIDNFLIETRKVQRSPRFMSIDAEFLHPNVVTFEIGLKSSSFCIGASESYP